MTPARFRQCVGTLGMSSAGLALYMGLDDRATRRMKTGEEPVPEDVARWLELGVQIQMDRLEAVAARRREKRA
jgi:hypothetical protein